MSSSPRTALHNNRDTDIMELMDVAIQEHKEIPAQAGTRLQEAGSPTIHKPYRTQVHAKSGTRYSKDYPGIAIASACIKTLQLESFTMLTSCMYIFILK